MVNPLQQELKQPVAFRSVEAETFLNVLRTSSALLGDLVELLRTFELTQPQYNVLRILRGAGPDGLLRGEVADRMVTREPDITRLLDRMESRDLVTRARTDRDRRAVRVRITAAGFALVAQLDEPVRAMHERQLGHMRRDDLIALNALLVAARSPAVAAPAQSERTTPA